VSTGHSVTWIGRLRDGTTRRLVALIAAQLGVAERTVRRKLVLIRSYWENEGAAA